MVGEEYVRAMVAFLTNDVAAVRARGRLAIIGADVQYRPDSQTATVHDSPMTGSLRVLSRNCRRGLALNGPLGAAMGSRRRVFGAERRPVVLRWCLGDDGSLCSRIASRPRTAHLGSPITPIV